MKQKDWEELIVYLIPIFKALVFLLKNPQFKPIDYPDDMLQEQLKSSCESLLEHMEGR